MVRQDIGALYLTEGFNVRYLIDVRVPFGQVFVPVEGDILAFVRARDLDYVQRKHQDVEKVKDADFNAELRHLRKDLVGGLRTLMSRYGVAGERLGLDSLRPDLVIQLFQAGIPIIEAELACTRASSVKTPDEITMYRAIGQQYVRTMEAFRDAVRPGITELELAALVTGTWANAGGEDMAQLNVCAQENMNPWGRWPSGRAVAAGEFVGLDLHGRSFGGLRGDASTTFLVGDDPTPAQRADYREGYDYLQAAKKELRAGRPIAEVMANQPHVPERIREQQFSYHMAHGIGLSYSGYPHLDPRAEPIDDVLRADQVLSVECVWAEAGKPYAVKLEEMILVRRGEPEVIGGIPVDERLLV
jgi:Xaa-Pro aminopeptidase